MSLVAFKARNHPQQTTNGVRDHVDDRALPQEDFNRLNDRFRFTLDAAASDQNHKLPRYFTQATDGLVQSWTGERVYCNPPYSDVRPWIEKAWMEVGASLIVLLLPANRTEQGWWQDLIEPHRDKAGSCLHVEFMRGRTRFIATGDDRIHPNMRPPFGCCLCIWNWA